MRAAAVTSIKATTLSPFHYHSLAVPGGTATLATFMADRSVAFGLAGAMGALAASTALPHKDYRRDLDRLPWLASMFEARNPRLMKPLGRRLTLDAEGGAPKRIADATGSGNLKDWFFIQEVPPGVVYEGAVFGPDPFAMASETEGRPVETIVMRTGRHLGGLVRLEKWADSEAPVRLNAHTAWLFGHDVEGDDRLALDVYALHDIQVTIPIAPGEAARIVGTWREFAA